MRFLKHKFYEHKNVKKAINSRYLSVYLENFWWKVLNKKANI